MNAFPPLGPPSAAISLSGISLRGSSGISTRLWRRATRRWRMGRHAGRVDALLASYPKSGRTWFRFILSNYFGLTNGTADVTLHSMFALLPNFDLDDVRGLPAFKARGGGARGDRPIPLVAAVHKPYGASTSGASIPDKPVIFMIRDPRDVMVSAFFHATKHKKLFVGDFDAFLGDEALGLPAFVRYINGWAHGLNGRRRIVLTYEELSLDAFAATADVLTFLNVPIDPAALRRAVALSRFDAMRVQEKREGLPKHDYDRGDDEALRMRRGKAGGYRDYMTDRQVERLEEDLRAGLTPGGRALVELTACKLQARRNQDGFSTDDPGSTPFSSESLAEGTFR